MNIILLNLHAFLSSLWCKSGERFSILILGVLLCSPFQSKAQNVPENYGNNASSVEWMVAETEHFIITYPHNFKELQKNVALYAEKANLEFKTLLGTEPRKKTELYINDDDEITSDARSVSIDSYKSIWHTNACVENLSGHRETVESLVRYELAYVFQENLQASDIGAWQYFFSRPSREPWANGLPTYLAEPQKTNVDTRWMRNYWLLNDEKNNSTIANEFNAIMEGRSQHQYF